MAQLYRRKGGAPLVNDDSPDGRIGGPPRAGITGTDGNDTLTGTDGADTINPLLGADNVDGLGGPDTLIVDYSAAPIDPYAGASIADVPSVIASSGGSFSGAVRTIDGGNFVNFTNIEHLQVKLDFWHNRFIIDGGALASGATILLDGGVGSDTLIMNLSALASVALQAGPGGVTASFGTIISFEAFELNLTAGADQVTTGAGRDVLTGNGGDDVLNSGDGNDILSGGSGSNSLSAGGGDDQIASVGIDTVDGGGNYDIWSGDYGASTANFSFTRNLAAGTATLSNGTTLTGIERIAALTTGSGNDVFSFAQSEATTITAGAGEDTLNLAGSGFSGEVGADGAGAFAGFLGYDRFSGIEHLNFVSGGVADSIAVNAAPLLGGATLSLDGGGGIDFLALDLTAFGAIGFVVAANGAVTSNVPLTVSNFEAYRIDSGAGADTIATQGGNDEIHAGGGNDVIGTAGGNDLLDGGGDADAMTGGAGNDIYLVDDAGDSVTELAGEGLDEVRTSLASYALGDSVEYLRGLSDGGQTLAGNGLDNLIFGGSGNDILIGGLGTDAMFGGLGDDTYHVDAAGDFVDEHDGAGADRVVASVSYALVAYVEIETLEAAAGSAPINLTGNRYAQLLRGNDGANILDSGDGNDILIGEGGIDTLIGGRGNDIYRVEEAGDLVVEYANEGTDAVYAVNSYALAAGSEVELLSAIDPGSSAAINLTGNEFANMLIGTAGGNTLIGGAGNDVLIGGAGNDFYRVETAGDTVVEGAGGGFDSVYAVTSYTLAAGSEVELLSAIDPGATGAMNLTGNEYANRLYGNAGVNVLIGGGGADMLFGGAGNDIYRVEEAGDTVVEEAGSGNDAVYAVTSYALAAGSEVELLSAIDPGATGAMDLTGNEYGNRLYGNAGVNVLIGGGGADILFGGAGNDIYRVEEAGDIVVEAAGGGNDAVYAVASYALAAGSEVELLSAIDPGAAGAMDLTGNEYANRLYGNAGANVLIGGGGADILFGGGGNDIYRVEEAGDVVVEAAGGGSDWVYAVTSYTLAAGSEVELLSAIDPGSAGAMDLTGNEFANRLYGTAGVNSLDGKSGNDVLTGGDGADVFAFTTALGAGNVDAIADFVAGADNIQLDDAVFAALAPGALNPNAFVTGAAAADIDDRIVYDSATGQLFYDSDGSGGNAAILFATLQGAPLLTASDFQVI